MLQIKNITFSYGQKNIFDNFSLSVNDAMVVHIKGANGSGKSTLLKILANLLFYSSGEIYDSHNQKIKSKTSYLDSENNGLFLNFSPLDNLKFWTDFYQSHHPELQKILKDWGVDQLRGLVFPVGRMSTGFKRRIGLLRVVLSQKKIWLLDEPTNGLDVKGIDLLAQSLKLHVQKQGIAFVVSHDERIFEKMDPHTLQIVELS